MTDDDLKAARSRVALDADLDFIAFARSFVTKALDEIERLRADATPGLIETVRREARQWQANHDQRRDERDSIRAQLTAMTAARDEACENWLAWLTAEGRGPQPQHDRLAVIRAVGKASE